MSDLVDQMKREIGSPQWRGWDVIERSIERYEVQMEDLSKVMGDAWRKASIEGGNGWDAVAAATLEFLPAAPVLVPRDMKLLQVTVAGAHEAIALRKEVRDLREQLEVQQVSVDAEARPN